MQGRRSHPLWSATGPPSAAAAAAAAAAPAAAAPPPPPPAAAAAAAGFAAAAAAAPPPPPAAAAAAHAQQSNNKPAAAGGAAAAAAAEAVRKRFLCRVRVALLEACRAALLVHQELGRTPTTAPRFPLDKLQEAFYDRFLESPDASVAGHHTLLQLLIAKLDGVVSVSAGQTDVRGVLHTMLEPVASLRQPATLEVVLQTNLDLLEELDAKVAALQAADAQAADAPAAAAADAPAAAAATAAAPPVPAPSTPQAAADAVQSLPAPPPRLRVPGPRQARMQPRR